MQLPRFRLWVVMVAVAVVALIAALMRPDALDRPFTPKNVVEALAHAARQAERRFAGFRLEDYDAEVRRDESGLFLVRFIKRDAHGKGADSFGFEILEGGYCMEMKRVQAPADMKAPR